MEEQRFKLRDRVVIIALSQKGVITSVRRDDVGDLIYTIVPVGSGTGHFVCRQYEIEKEV